MYLKGYGIFEGKDIYLMFDHLQYRRKISIFENNKYIKGMSYAKFICLMNGFEIPENYEVDHIDGNALNDIVENLQIIPSEMNLIKEKYDNMLLQRYAVYVCNICGKTFFIKENVDRFKPVTQIRSCSRQCSYEYKRRKNKEIFVNNYKGVSFDLSTIYKYEQILIKNNIKFCKNSLNKHFYLTRKIYSEYEGFVNYFGFVETDSKNTYHLD